MGQYSLDMQIYFWLIDRAHMKDDPRNKVIIEDNIVQLHRDYANKLDNGIYISILMEAIRKTMVQKVSKPMSLDPLLKNLKDQPGQNAKQANWDVIGPELKKFQIKCNKETVAKIVQGSSEIVSDMLKKLMDFDQQIMIQPNVQSNVSKIQGNNTPRAVSKKTSTERSPRGKKLDIGSPRKTDIGPPVLNSPPAKKRPSPVKIPIRKESGDEMEQFERAESEPKTQESFNIGNIRSLPDFVLQTLSFTLEMGATQVTALLASNQKFLVLMCFSGMKGGDYSKIRQWYTVMLSRIDTFVELCLAEPDDAVDLKLSLNVIKSGLYSRDLPVVEGCARFFSKLWQRVQQEQEFSQRTMHVQNILSDWFLGKHSEATIRNQEVEIHEEWLKAPKKPTDLEKLATQPGMSAFLRAWFMHGDRVVDSFALALINYGKSNYIETFNSHLRRHILSFRDFFSIMLDLIDVITNTQKGKAALISSNAIKTQISWAISICRDNEEISGLVERQVGLTFLVHIWRYHTQVIEQMQVQDGIIQCLKLGCKNSKSSAMMYTSIHLTFGLLFELAKDRKQYAPIIYKALTFLLIDGYHNEGFREEMLKNFISLFKNYQIIPIAILCDPLFKQILINLEKDEVQPGNFSSKILQPGSVFFNLNTTDFDLFSAIASHPKLQQQLAVKLVQILFDVACKHIIFTRVSIKLIIQLLGRFDNHKGIEEALNSFIQSKLKLIAQQDVGKVAMYLKLKDQLIKERDQNRRGFSPRRKPSKAQVSPIRKSIDYNMLNLELQSPTGRLDDHVVSAVFDHRIFPEETRTYTNYRMIERMIVNVLQALIHNTSKAITESIRQSVLESIVKTENKAKFRNRGLLYLTSIFGKDVESQIKQKRVRLAKERLQKAHAKQVEKKAAFEMETSERESNPNPNTLPQLKRRKNTHVELKNPPLDSDYHASAADRSDHESPRQRKIHLKVRRSPSNLSDGHNLKSKLPLIGKSKRSESLKRLASSNVSPRNQIKLYDITKATAQVQNNYMLLLKKKFPMYKAMFSQYTNRSKQPTDFDSLNDKGSVMTIPDVFKFMSDMRVNRHHVFKNPNEFKQLLRQINVKMYENANNRGLDLEGFIELMLQLGYITNNKQSEDPTIFMPLFFETLKDGCQNTQPMINHMLDASYPSNFVRRDALIELTNKVNENSEFVLPPGFLKEKIKPVPMREQMIIARDILGGILHKSLNIKLKTPEKWIVKTDPNYSKDKKRSKRNEKAGTTTNKAGSLDDEESEPEVLLPLDIKSLMKPKRKVFKTYRIAGKGGSSRRAETTDQGSTEEVNQTSFQDTTTNSYPSGLLGNQAAKIRAARRKKVRLESPPKLLNRIETIKKQDELNRMQEKNLKQERFLKRRDELKIKMEEVEKAKLEKEKEQRIQKKETLNEQREKQRMFEEEKSKFYEKLKEQYETERLPEIKQKEKEAREAKKKQIEQNKKKKEEALKKIEDQAEQMKQKLDEMHKKRLKLERKEKLKEKKIKLQMDMFNQQYNAAPKVLTRSQSPQTQRQKRSQSELKVSSSMQMPSSLQQSQLPQVLPNNKQQNKLPQIQPNNKIQNQNSKDNTKRPPSGKSVGAKQSLPTPTEVSQTPKQPIPQKNNEQTKKKGLFGKLF